MSSTRSRDVFIAAAEISAEVHFAVMQARNLSLTAKNARAISVRAGDKTAGFRAITDYIDSLSLSTITQSQAINEHAVRISQLSVGLARIGDLIDQYLRVYQQQPGAEFLSSMDRPFRVLQQRRETLQREFDRCTADLHEAIHEVRQQMRSANVIATSSKVEASQAGEFQEALTVIADNIEQTTDSIKTHLEKALAKKHGLDSAAL